MEICRLATCGHGLQRSSNYYSGIRCRIFRRGEAAHVKFGQGQICATCCITVPANVLQTNKVDAQCDKIALTYVYLLCHFGVELKTDG